MIFVVEGKRGADWIPVGVSRRAARAQQVRAMLEKGGKYSEYRVSVYQLLRVLPG